MIYVYKYMWICQISNNLTQENEENRNTAILRRPLSCQLLKGEGPARKMQIEPLPKMLVFAKVSSVARSL